jgi:arylsulfatase A-like enzyme
MGMNRREFAKNLAAGMGAAMVPGISLAQTDNAAAAPAIMKTTRRPGDRPNLLFVISDQRRADTMAVYGNMGYKVPVINRLASQSVIFEHAYCTQPLCTPSRSSMLTGTWPHQNGCVHNNLGLKPEAKTVPELLADSDYRTAYMGKWHLGDEIFRQHGFDEWRSIEDGIYESYYSPGRDKNARSTYDHFLRSLGYKPNNKGNTFDRKFAAELPLEQTKASYLATEASKFIYENRQQPWLLYVSFLEPHPPQTSVLNDLHTDAEAPLPKNYPGIPTTPEPDSYKCDRQRTAMDQSGFQKVARNYAGMCSVVDQALGRILWMLEVTVQAENTIVVYTADHGDMLGSHSLLDKQVMYEESIRVPHLLRVPFRGQRETRIAQPVSHIDIVPTLMELLGQKVSGLAGRSLVPILEGRRPPEDVFLEWTEAGNDADGSKCPIPSGRTVVSSDGYKLVLYNAGQSTLFDRSKDPLEMSNVFGRRQYAGVQARLTKSIAKWQKESGDGLQLPG